MIPTLPLKLASPCTLVKEALFPNALAWKAWFEAPPLEMPFRLMVTPTTTRSAAITKGTPAISLLLLLIPLIGEVSRVFNFRIGCLLGPVRTISIFSLDPLSIGFFFGPVGWACRLASGSPQKSQTSTASLLERPHLAHLIAALQRDLLGKRAYLTSRQAAELHVFLAAEGHSIVSREATKAFLVLLRYANENQIGTIIRLCCEKSREIGVLPTEGPN